VEETNDLLARLSRSFDNERRFTGDAAHELRTPLAALRIQAEVALTTATEERRRRALEQVVAGVERATRVVEQMLLLARLDAAEGVPLAPVPLAATCREAIAEAAPPARARRVDVALDAPDEVMAQGDRVMLLAVVRNLVDNAVRHAPDSGQVRVTVYAEGGKASLAVEDSGPGVPPEQRDRIFDRFFRGPEGRGTGSGLGLSIVRRVVELHGGSFAATSSPSLGGLRIEVRLPLQP
jgi:two-component system sensor histidine kinase QseC